MNWMHWVHPGPPEGFLIGNNLHIYNVIKLPPPEDFGMGQLF